MSIDFFKALRLEFDSLPHHLYEEAKDCGGLSITRLLSQPLFQEEENRSISTSLFEAYERQDENSWKLTISDAARWSDGCQITAWNICTQIKQIYLSKAVSFPLVLHLKKVQPLSERVLRVETRIPLAHINRLLANPAFSPRHCNSTITSGAYSIMDRTEDRLTLQSSKESKSLDIVKHSQSTHDLFDTKYVDFSGPMTVAPEKFSIISAQETTHVFNMDILYVLHIPIWVTSDVRHFITQNLDRVKICAAAGGIVTPKYYLSSCWENALPHINNVYQPTRIYQQHNPPDKVLLLYTDFMGNREIAEAVRQQLCLLTGMNIHIEQRDYYKDFLLSPCDDYCFRIMLVSSLWPHPASMLTPFYFSQEATEEFKCSYRDAVNIENLSKAQLATQNAEEILNYTEPRLAVIGRVNGCFRGRGTPMWWPPSGWLDARNL